MEPVPFTVLHRLTNLDPVEPHQYLLNSHLLISTATASEHQSVRASDFNSTCNMIAFPSPLLPAAVDAPLDNALVTSNTHSGHAYTVGTVSLGLVSHI